mmetsp:Transcript_75387/g.140620  ORF Transcript_75387/g.140620 Transcript_75387/m.140620 type:complete len:315 (-) Transcript_75387:292-1236(-)
MDLRPEAREFVPAAARNAGSATATSGETFGDRLIQKLAASMGPPQPPEVPPRTQQAQALTSTTVGASGPRAVPHVTSTSATGPTVSSTGVAQAAAGAQKTSCLKVNARELRHPPREMQPEGLFCPDCIAGGPCAFHEPLGRSWEWFSAELSSGGAIEQVVGGPLPPLPAFSPQPPTSNGQLQPEPQPREAAALWAPAGDEARRSTSSGMMHSAVETTRSTGVKPELDDASTDMNSTDVGDLDMRDSDASDETANSGLASSVHRGAHGTLCGGHLSTLPRTQGVSAARAMSTSMRPAGARPLAPGLLPYNSAVWH